MPLDTTLDTMDETRFRNKNSDLLKKLLKKTHFNMKELEAVFLIYFKLQRDNGERAQFVSRHQFRTIFHICFNMPENTLMDRIFAALDRSVSPYVGLETWAKSMSLFLRGTLDEKIIYCFGAYDITGEGLIKRDQMIMLLKHSVYKHQVEDVEEAVKDFVDIIIKRMDLDHDGMISFNDYSESVKNTPELLECFGHCLPERATVYSFLLTFTHVIRKF